MYNEFFGFKESPFSIAPDPRYLYMSEQHREALAHLIYGINGDGGFVLLTGEVGTGKTTICRCLLEQIPDNCSTAFILNPRLTVEELLATICDEFRIKYPPRTKSIKVFTDLINRYLLDVHSNGGKAVLIIDEAQNLSPDVLEQLRLLTNLETNKKKLLQIILIGQPELRKKLQMPELKQLSQRIIARYHLGTLSRDDVSAYIRHRLTVAGGTKNIFTDSSMDLIYKYSKGIPRLINMICDRALLGAYAYESERVTDPIVKRAAREILDYEESDKKGIHGYLLYILAFLLLISILGIAYKVYSPDNTGSREEIKTPSSLDQNLSGNNTLHKAMKILLQEWGINTEINNNTNPCRQIKAHGLRCLRSTGSLRDIVSLNRPAVLKLYDLDNNNHYVALTGINNNRLNVIVNERTLTISMDEIYSRWFGEYIILWRPPPEYTGPVYPGHKGDIIRWIEERLSKIQDREPLIKDKPVYDNIIMNYVKRFQMEEGLIPDGIIGPRTIIHINTRTMKDIPLLISQKEG